MNTDPASNMIFLLYGFNGHQLAIFDFWSRQPIQRFNHPKRLELKP